MLVDATLALPQASRSYLMMKRTLDIGLSALVLLALAPLLALIAVLIRLTSRGPILFRQVRVGEGGRLFVMYKFRSMYHDADHTLHQLAYTQFIQGKGGNGKVGSQTLALASAEGQGHATPPLAPRAARIGRVLWRIRGLLHLEDPRITPVGALLRLTSLDELPQLFNVLAGHMSLVGPRPPIPYEVRLYQSKHLLRLTVRPGLTGIWQVYGRGHVPFEQMVDMDIEYIRRRGVWQDFKLIVLTLPAMLHAHGPR
ncbi:MAG: sugar transferase [Ktedonobacterales bacterium]|nr:sugar transferase [Ktedonobacterales bacterium]